jgi:hypothetical protein
MRARQTYSDIATLAKLIAALVPHDGTVELRLPGVRVARVSQTNREPMHYVQRSSLCLVAQGAKVVMIGGRTYGYEAAQMAVYSIDVPMAGQVTRASLSEPYLLLMIDLDAEKITELSLKVFPHGLPQPRDTRALYVGNADAHIIDAATRLLELMAQPVDAELLAPLVRDEILIRLLRSPLGSRVAQIGQAGSSVQRIANAVSWLRANFDQLANIEYLAKMVNMSVNLFQLGDEVEVQVVGIEPDSGKIRLSRKPLLPPPTEEELAAAAAARASRPPREDRGDRGERGNRGGGDHRRRWQG